MTITLCYSMQFSDRTAEIKTQLEHSGHLVFISSFHTEYVEQTPEEIEKRKLKHKNENDAIGEHWRHINNSDCILVLNYTKNNIENYIGGNVFLEMGFAYVLGKPIYLLNPIPKMPFYETEIIAMKPIIINNDLTKI